MMWHCIHFKMLNNFFSLEEYFGPCPRKKIILLSHHISKAGPLWLLCLIVCFCSDSKGSWKSNILGNWRWGKRNQTWDSIWISWRSSRIERASIILPLLLFLQNLAWILPPWRSVLNIHPTRLEWNLHHIQFFSLTFSDRIIFACP